MQKFETILNNFNIILASASRRRKDLLAALDINFTLTEVLDVDETYPAELKPDEIACFLAEKKSNIYNLVDEKDILITADTVVVCNNRIIGKPENYENAVEMLKFLSGKTHSVITGVCLRSISKKRNFNSVTEVSFCELSDEEIEYYIKNYKPFDKAGAYGIQEWIGHIAVKEIKGSYFNVVGLPIQKLYRELLKFVNS
ncbi:MAG TPA: Maf family nucleotide pyrophosphatase [Bacteroidales bacterium]|nr:Maf family nucleotide pyrophosphatase [Bacteroidales bacterium]HOL98361.1 Maf family nucleotide pyrophosphatase [Bacteroidales bacterium]HOM36794.1 Maf family nucleotide pyrophosphatase [Bacteroidales bacterium]HPD24640.1 Maf family nucleotide pyrophosphatase [Bacteroidales bacterium]HRS99530.1 Maf family nucleotide pyrophosphatase [Bacteroidales bacterium]